MSLWPEPITSRYLLAFGRLTPEMFVPTWGVARVAAGDVIGEPTIWEQRPVDFTHDSFRAWLIDSDVDPDTARAIADRMVAHHPDLFLTER